MSILRRLMFDLGSLNPQQREAVMTHRGPVLILAGAGTGKTRTLTCRIAHMIQNGIGPGQILAVTFTNKAAREMQERVNEMLRLPTRRRRKDGAEVERPTLCTFHSLCVRILRQHIERLGYKRNFVIYDEGDQVSAIKRILAAFPGKGEKTDASAVLGMLSRHRNGGLKGALAVDPEVQALLEHVQRRYESALRAANAVDFDDLILLTLRLFREHPEALEACRARWPYVMVDEYQDTNASQFELVHRLTEASRNLCVVGDDDQSIYGWRGAEIANILNLEEHYPEVKVIKLEQNYRSTNIILKAANAVIRNNPRRRGKTLWSAKGQGTKITLYALDSDEEEARVVAGNIETDRLVDRIPWRSQAILFRTNLQARPIEVELRKARIRYRVVGGQSFFDRREIKDFLAYLKAFVNPHDDVSLLRIANTPSRGLSDVTMERLLGASAERKCSVFSVMRHTDVLAQFQTRVREAIARFTGFIERVRAPLEQPAPLMLRTWAAAWLGEIQFYEALRASEKDPEAGENRARNVQEIVATLDGEDAPPLPTGTAAPVMSLERSAGQGGGEHGPDESTPVRSGARPMDRLDEFLADLTLDQEREEDKETTGDMVTLITTHAVKGLEFPHVHIVGVEDGLLPHSRSKVEGTLDEERRLFYVAITRAQESLRISHCGSRKRYGQAMPCHPSPFLKELPEDCVQHAEEVDSTPVNSERGVSLFAQMRAALE